MEKITFDNLPNTMGEILDKINKIEISLQSLLISKDPSCELLNISQAATLLNLAESTIYGKVSRMEIPVNKKGKKLYFIKDELLNWVRSGKNSTNSEIQEKADQFFKKKSRFSS